MRHRHCTVLFTVLALMACLVSLGVAVEPSSHTTVALLFQDDVLMLEPDDLVFLEAGQLVIVPGGTGAFGTVPSLFALTGTDLYTCTNYAAKKCTQKCGSNGSKDCAIQGVAVCQAQNNLANAQTSIDNIADSSCNENVIPEVKEN